MANIHDGHRDRAKQKFREHGLESFTDIEAIELLLMYGIPRRDTNPLAHALLERFHDFRGVLEAEIPDLEAVEGIGPTAATLIALVTALNRRYLAAKPAERPMLRDTEALGDYLLPMFAYLHEEVAVLLCMDSASRPIACRILGRGSPGSVHFSAREIVDITLRENAARVVLAHNHPSGIAIPSSADVCVTQELRHMLSVIGAELVDHLIICNGDYVSMRDSGYFREG